MRMNQKKRDEYRVAGNGYYHFCTDGLKDALLFYDEDEFAFGMRVVGLIAYNCEITVYAFTLMPNHIHIILRGNGKRCLEAFDLLKRKVSARLVTDGHSPLPEDYWFKLVKIQTEEQMRGEIVYVLRNPLEKNLATVGGYLWGSAWLYHSSMRTVVDGIPAGSYSKRQLERMLLGRDIIPDEWLMHPYLGLLPGSFVDTSLVERLFPNPKDLQVALVKDYEMFFQTARRLGELQEFSKSEISSIVSNLLQSRFSGKSLRDLSEAERGRLSIILNREYGLDSYQISTSIFIKEIIVRQLLASKELR